ncbi:MAG: selenide, water dikinase SelD [Rhodospirillaceae bacterium]|jgi:selenide, water dikinase|nr:selenide, water dikinase SelD [Rhodospirillaceae bacterium]MBT5895705.1 selenide, water dikinase SelD [Rhodospirillaceae bacterium]MBT6426978.1 selenide, water dikinase SelD [Rhodospirillaceae bacterium]
MKTSSDAIVKDLVLVGGGHSHVIVLKKFAMNPLPGVRLTVIARDVHTPYSGMLPGYVAGHYDFDEVHIDLRPLCQFAGARLYNDTAVKIDTQAKRVICHGRPAVPYDVLSINIGSTPSFNDIAGAADYTTPVKPINNFIDRWDSLVARVLNSPGQHRIGVVGAGAGGMELLLAAQHRLGNLLAERGQSADGLEFHLISRSDRILPDFGQAVGRRFERRLRARGVHVHDHAEATEVAPGRLSVTGGKTIALDEILWVTAASAPSWLADSGLDVDDAGFIQVRDTLQSTSHDDIFAAGDIAAVVNHPRPKAGVFAVRQGPPLNDNLRRVLLSQPARPFSPQENFLVLITTGDKNAVAAKWGWTAEGRWVWRWKDWIDRRFMRKFNELPEMAKEATAALNPGLADKATLSDISAIAMRCGGCGAKVGADVLNRALSELEPVPNEDVLIGLHSPDDAAVVQIPEGKVAVHTVDYFRAFIDDAYVFGQVAANHALSDIFAMGAEAQSALAIATVPFGLEAKVEASLREMMTGAMEVLNDAGATLVGGHTSEGPELALGFSVNGLADRDTILRKGGMAPGDVLILTKPLGTGTLFAADMQQKAKGRWIENALKSMVQSNRLAAQCLFSHGASACTDVTGFGLLGHAVEMTKASNVDVEFDMAALPIMDGALDTVRLGILSSLQPANVRLRRAIRNMAAARENERYPLLFDPQTSGGLLASIQPEAAAACLQELHDLGYEHAAIVGRVHEETDHLEPITLVA